MSQIIDKIINNKKIIIVFDYILIYLSVLIINIINKNDLFSDYKFLIYNLITFIYISIAGTSFYWSSRLKHKLNSLL